jgi:hypothetical protein
LHLEISELLPRKLFWRLPKVSGMLVRFSGMSSPPLVLLPLVSYIHNLETGIYLLRYFALPPSQPQLAR